MEISSNGIASRVRAWRELQQRFLRDRHILDTWTSLVYKDRSRLHPRYVVDFVGRYRAFKEWSIESGVTIRHELILTQPRILLYSCDERKTEVVWQPNEMGLSVRRFEKTGGLTISKDADFPVDEWVTDYSVLWVPVDQVAKMRPLPTMVAYSQTRVRRYRNTLRAKAARKPRRGSTKKLTLDGEMKSISAWSRDPRCPVSDKIIRKRLESGWEVEEAITAPDQKGGRPRKR